MEERKSQSTSDFDTANASKVSMTPGTSSAKENEESASILWKETDERLEHLAESHGLTPNNVKDILRHLIKNPPEIARLLGMANGDVEENSGRFTRSRARSAQQSQGSLNLHPLNVVRRNFLNVDYGEGDDDEDYHPSDESPSEDDSEEEDVDEETNKDASNELEMRMRSEQAERNFDHLAHEGERSFGAAHFDYVDDASGSAWNDNLGSEMLLTSAASPGYLEFLNAVSEDPLAASSMLFEEEDDDPDYVPDCAEEGLLLDIDEHREDRTTLIPKREVLSLVRDIVPEEILLAQESGPRNKITEIPESTTSTGWSDGWTRPPLLEDTSASLQPYGNYILVTKRQMVTLKEQMQQHVQLAMNLLLGCLLEPTLVDVKHEMEAIFNELSAGHNEATTDSSPLRPSNLSNAIQTINEAISRGGLKERVQEVLLEESSHPPLPLEEVCTALSSSQANLYPSLVPRCRLLNFFGLRSWSWGESLLLSTAIFHFRRFAQSSRYSPTGKYQLIARHSMPWRRVDEIRNRVSAIKKGARAGDGPHQQKCRWCMDVMDGRRWIGLPSCDSIEQVRMSEWPQNRWPSWFAYTAMEQSERCCTPPRSGEEVRLMLLKDLAMSDTKDSMGDRPVTPGARSPSPNSIQHLDIIQESTTSALFGELSMTPNSRHTLEFTAPRTPVMLGFDCESQPSAANNNDAVTEDHSSAFRMQNRTRMMAPRKRLPSEREPIECSKKSRLTHADRDRLGIEAMALTWRSGTTMEPLAKHAAEDILSRMFMHSASMRRMQEALEKGTAEEAMDMLMTGKGEEQMDILCLLSLFLPPESIPPAIAVLSLRRSYQSAIEMLTAIVAYSNATNRSSKRPNSRSILKDIARMGSHSNDPQFFRPLEHTLRNQKGLWAYLSQHLYPLLCTRQVPPSQYEMIHLTADFAPGTAEGGWEEISDMEKAFGRAPSKKQLLRGGRRLSALSVNEGRLWMRKNGKPEELDLEWVPMAGIIDTQFNKELDRALLTMLNDEEEENGAIERAASKCRTHCLAAGGFSTTQLRERLEFLSNRLHTRPAV